MKNISTKLVPWSLALAAWGSSMAYAAQDLPGGPAVNQLNLHPPVTRIAVEQHWLHWMMLIIWAIRIWLCLKAHSRPDSSSSISVFMSAP